MNVLIDLMALNGHCRMAACNKLVDHWLSLDAVSANIRANQAKYVQDCQEVLAQKDKWIKNRQQRVGEKP